MSYLVRPMSYLVRREWRFYLADMIEFAGKVLSYTSIPGSDPEKCVIHR